MNDEEVFSIVVTAIMTGITLVLLGLFYYVWKDPVGVTLSAGAFGGFLHEFVQSKGKVLFIERKDDGLYLGSISGLILGLVAGILIYGGTTYNILPSTASNQVASSIQGIAGYSFIQQAPTLQGNLQMAQLLFEGLIAGIALKGISEAATSPAKIGDSFDVISADFEPSSAEGSGGEQDSGTSQGSSPPRPPPPPPAAASPQASPPPPPPTSSQGSSETPAPMAPTQMYAPRSSQVSVSSDEEASSKEEERINSGDVHLSIKNNMNTKLELQAVTMFNERDESVTWTRQKELLINPQGAENIWSVPEKNTTTVTLRGFRWKFGEECTVEVLSSNGRVVADISNPKLNQLNPQKYTQQSTNQIEKDEDKVPT